MTDRLPDIPDLVDSASTVELIPGPREKIYFISDLHLGDGSFADIFQGKDRAFLAFLDEVEKEGKALVINGDAVDFSEAWYLQRVLKAHGRLLKRLNRLADKMQVIYCWGNHDSDILLWKDILRWTMCRKLVIGDHRMLVQHGFEYDRFISNNMSKSDVWVRILNIYERVFKTWVRVPLSDYYTVSNRLVHYLFLHLTRLQSLNIRWLRWRGRLEEARKIEQNIELWTQTELGDPMSITRPVLERLKKDRYEYIVCGHSHLPGIVEEADNKRYVNLGSWTFGNAQYGVWDGEQFVLRDWITGRVYGDDNYRPIFEGVTDLNYEEWFHSQYMGYLRFRCGEESNRTGVRPPSRLKGPRGVIDTETLTLPEPTVTDEIPPDGAAR